MRRKKGQGTLEYGILIAVVIAALLLMATFVRRGYQGRLRQAGEQMGDQFDPFATSANQVTVSVSYQDETTTGGRTYQESKALSQVQSVIPQDITGTELDLSKYGELGEVQVSVGNEETGSWRQQ